MAEHLEICDICRMELISFKFQWWQFLHEQTAVQKRVPVQVEGKLTLNLMYVKIIYPMGVSAASRSSLVDSNSDQASRSGRREAKFMD